MSRIPALARPMASDFWAGIPLQCGSYTDICITPGKISWFPASSLRTGDKSTTDQGLLTGGWGENCLRHTDTTTTESLPTSRNS